MSSSGKAAQRALDVLSRRGPHEVLRGDLALVGLPGAVFTPDSGLGLPAVAFGHGWLQPIYRYEELLGHLASWGIVVAAPSTASGPLTSHRGFADDLRTALDVCAGVRLGPGEISVDPERLALAGHGMGGGGAVLAAADDDRCKAVVTLALAETRPSAVDAAARCAMPGLHIAGTKDRVAPPVAHAEPVAQAWAGPVRLRVLDKADHLSFLEHRHWSDLFVDGKPNYGIARLSRAMVTAFLLHHLTGEKSYDDLLDGELKHSTVEIDRSS